MSYRIAAIISVVFLVVGCRTVSPPDSDPKCGICDQDNDIDFAGIERLEYHESADGVPGLRMWWLDPVQKGFGDSRIVMQFTLSRAGAEPLTFTTENITAARDKSFRMHTTWGVRPNTLYTVQIHACVVDGTIPKRDAPLVKPGSCETNEKKLTVLTKKSP